MSTHPAAPMERERMTLAQWAALDDDVRGELVDGALVEEEVPNTIHEVLVMWLAALLHAWGRPRRVFVFSSGVKLALSSARGRIPDVTVYLPDAGAPQLRGAVDVPPSIAVEVVSDTPRDARRDRVEKLAEYAAFGIRWYWIVDPELRAFEILELGPDGRYVHAVAVTAGTVAPVPGCDGLSIDVDAIWAEIDDLVERAGQEQERRPG